MFMQEVVSTIFLLIYKQSIEIKNYYYMKYEYIAFLDFGQRIIIDY